MIYDVIQASAARGLGVWMSLKVFLELLTFFDDKLL